MKAFNLIAALITATLIPTAVFAQEALKPCGTVTRNTTLKSDCAAPMIIGADNIKVNLNGFAVKADLNYYDFNPNSIGFIDAVNRHGVAITNGTIGGLCRRCIRIEGGYGNKVSNLSLVPEGDGGVGVIVLNSRENLIKNVKILGRDARWGVIIRDSDRNTIDHLTNEDRFDGGVFIDGSRNRLKRSILKISKSIEYPEGVRVFSGKRNVIEKNKFSCEGIPGIAISGTTGIETVGTSSDTTIKSNTIYACEIGMNIMVPRTIIKDSKITSSSEVGIRVTSLENTIRSNTVANSGTMDMVDTNPNCGTNEWRRNSFTTDSEGDGPNSGCIR